MTLNNFIEGLRLLQKYYADPDGYHINTGHEQIFADSTLRLLTSDDYKRMRELGWFQPETPEDDDNFDYKNYDPEECWSCYI